MSPAMKSGLWSYIKAAFNARPIGMFVPPNWVGLVGFAMLGILNPGFWAIGAGLELAYLFGLSTNSRFQRVVDAKKLLEQRKDWQQRLSKMIGQLGSDERERYWKLERRAQAILEQQRSASGETAELQMQAEGLGRLLWIYLTLLRTRQQIVRVVRESLDLERNKEPLDRRIQRLNSALEKESVNEDLRKSLEGQLEILRQRMEKRKETREKLVFLDAELVRIEEQVELIREQAVMASEPHAVSERIDNIASTLSGTQQWIRDQQKILGAMDEALTEPPPLTAGPARVAE
jgi:hypothetical protein